MTRKQLVALFLSILIPYSVGGLLMPLLPVYLARLGIDAAVSGFYFAVAFLALAGGSIAAGWISDRFQRRKWTIFLAGLAGLPTIFLMGQVNHIIPLTILTILVWFFGGLIVATVNILAGLFADASERGRIFGIIGTGLSIGAVFGGFASGALVERWGFAALFTFTALLEFIQMGSALLLEDKEVKIKRSDESTTRLPVMNAALWLLFGAGIMVNGANLSTGLSRPLGMDMLGFGAAAVASANAIAGLLTLPFSSLLGWLSDKVGRKPVLIMAYSMSILGALMLVSATSLWHFWLAAAFMTIAPVSMGVGTALVTDVTEPETLAAAVSRWQSTPFIGGAIGFAGGGILISNFGIHPTYIGAVFAAVLAVLLLIPIGARRKAKVLAYAKVD